MSQSPFQNCSKDQLLKINKMCKDRMINVAVEKKKEYLAMPLYMKIYSNIYWRSKFYYWRLFDKDEYEKRIDFKKYIK